MSIAASFSLNDFTASRRELDYLGKGKALSKMFSCIDGVTPKKMASNTVKVKGGEKIKAAELFTLSSFRWLYNYRAIDFTESGGNADVGQTEIGGIVVEKRACGATEYIMSRFLASRDKGSDTDIIWTKPDKAGDGHQVYIQIKLHTARISDWELYCCNDYPLMERYVIKFPKVSFWFYHETVQGKLEKGGAVTFDTVEHTMSSGHK